MKPDARWAALERSPYLPESQAIRLGTIRVIPREGGGIRILPQHLHLEAPHLRGESDGVCLN